MASSSSAPDKSSELLFVGQQCSAKTCYTVDFLPFKCQHCKESYCGEHYLPQQHECPKYDVTKVDRVAPPCPLCNKPITIPIGEDPNIKMSQHIESDCHIATGKTAKPSSSTPRCENVRCKKVLFAPIKCETCKHQFCAEHRFPSSHHCTDAAAAPSSKPSDNPLASTQARIQEAKEKLTPQAAAGLAAMKRAMNNTTSKTKTATSKSNTAAAGTTSTPSKSSHNPITTIKTDRWVPPSSKERDDDLGKRPASPTSPPSPQLSCKSESLLSSPNATSWHPPPLFGTA